MRLREYFLKFVKIDFLVGENSLKNWSVLLFIILLGIIMIYSSHLAEQKVFTIAKLNEEVKELQNEFTDYRSQLQLQRLESSVLKPLKEQGIKQSDTPPQKIKVIVKN